MSEKSELSEELDTEGREIEGRIRLEELAAIDRDWVSAEFRRHGEGEVKWGGNPVAGAESFRIVTRFAISQVMVWIFAFTPWGREGWGGIMAVIWMGAFAVRIAFFERKYGRYP